MADNDITTHGRLSVGDRVIAPGHRRSDPDSPGVLTRIYFIEFPRAGKGYFGEVTTDAGPVVSTAIGIIRPER